MPTYSFYADKKLVEQIDARNDNRSEAISRDLEFYYMLLADARRALKATLTGEELYLICDALNGTIIDTLSVKYLRQEIVDAIELNGLDKKWKVDRHALDKKFAGMTLVELCALGDAVRYFWHRVSEGEDDKSPSELGVLD
ncbi:MAG: hypothetical protein M3416_01465 [Acidobacteriota bacterium]|nr:hypothetical protein [Acidobacteriota bacterium]